MDYIIDSAKIQKNTEKLVKSLYIKNNKVAYISNQLNKYSFIRMNVSQFQITPGHIVVDYDMLKKENFIDFKNRQLELIGKGVTTVLVICKVKYEKEIEDAIKRTNHAMINSSIDYVIGLSVPVSLIRPTVIRRCKQKKIPVLVTDITAKTSLEDVKWGWVREAMFSYNMPIYPLFKFDNSKVQQKFEDQWKQIMADHSMPTSTHFPSQLDYLKKDLLKQIGIYPHKGELLVGGDVDYNLYLLKNEIVEHSSNLDYDKVKPSITVHKGKILKSDQSLFFSPGYGEEIIIKVPGYFTNIN